MPGPLAGDTSAGTCDWSMSMRAATMPAIRDVCSATPAVVPSTTLWMTFDNRLLSPSSAWLANSTLVVPPTVVSVTAGMVFRTAGKRRIGDALVDQHILRRVAHRLIVGVADTGVGLDDLPGGVALHGRVGDVRNAAAVAAARALKSQQRLHVDIGIAGQ